MPAMVRFGRVDWGPWIRTTRWSIKRSPSWKRGGRRQTPGAREYFWPHYVEPETHWPMGDVFLSRDDLPRFFELMFNNLAAAVHEDFRVGCEAREGVVSVSPADAEHWRMVRDMFVREVGGYDGSEQGLFLLQAIPRSWLRPGERLAVTEMGTYFGGKISLDVQVAEDGNSVTVDAKLMKLAVKPKNIRIRLRPATAGPWHPQPSTASRLRCSPAMSWRCRFKAKELSESSAVSE